MKKYKWQIIGGSVLAVLLITVITIAVKKINRNKRTYLNFDVVGETAAFGESSEVNYLPAAKGVFRYTRDGAKVIDKKGNTVASFSYTMNKPSGDTCGNAAAVGEIGGRSLVIMANVDNAGAVTTVTTPYPIVKVQVASQGVTAVWMNDGEQDFIHLYDAEGNLIADLNTPVSLSGFPIDIALSNDGTKLVTAYVNYEKDVFQTQLTFYNFGLVGGNYKDKLVDLQIFKDEMVADVEFMNNNTVVAFAEDGFFVYDMPEIPVLKQEIRTKEVIRSAAYSDKYIGQIVEGGEGSTNFVIRVYNLDGKIVDEKQTNEWYTGFRIDKGDAILFNDSGIYIYRVGGRDKLKIEIKKSLKYVALMKEPNEYIFVGDSFLERVRLVGEKK